ncbi:MAG TPA: hypothetical protein VNA25_29645 [Phycisphaerae bacterium]|nr:hypothetical protein [Phycisphaerae bacterium]
MPETETADTDTEAPDAKTGEAEAAAAAAVADDKAKTADSGLEGIPKKFLKEDGTVDHAKLAKSYTALEARMSAQADAILARDEIGPDEMVRQMGLEAEEVAARWLAKGELTAEQYKAFKDHGVGKSMVDSWYGLAARLGQLQQAATLAKIEEAAGGPEKLEAARKWGATNLTDDQMEWFNSQVNDTAAPQLAVPAVQWLMDRFNQATGSAGSKKLISGEGGAVGTDGGPFKTRAEMTAALRDPRCKESSPDFDRAYQQSVERRMKQADPNSLP